MTKKRIMVLLLILLILCPVRTQAKNRMVWLGRRTGWVTINGDTYYIHVSRSRMYNRGEPCWDAYRWHNGKLYYFGYDGKMIKRDTKLIKLNRDHSVKYIYTPGNKDDRYNVRRRRYQRRISGKWSEYGMQTNIYWMVDWQW